MNVNLDEIALLLKSAGLDAVTSDNIKLCNKLTEMCVFRDEDSLMDKFFKAFIRKGNVTGAMKLCDYNHVRIFYFDESGKSRSSKVIEEDFIPAIAAHCCNNLGLTLIAKKILYFCAENQPVDIEIQLNALLKHNKVDLSRYLEVMLKPKYTEKFNHIYLHGYEPWERNGFYEYDDKGKIILPDDII